MNWKRIAFVAGWMAGCALGTATHASANSNGAPALTSGGPFPGENNCTMCHTGSEVNSGSGTLQLLVGDSPASEYAYAAGETVSFLVRFSDTNAVRVGFQLTVRSGDGCGQPGTLAAGTTDAGSSIQIGEGPCGPASTTVEWATQRRPRTGSSAEFEVAWTPPADGAGPVTVAVAVNGANGNLSTSGDQIYTQHTTIQPAATPSATPAISEGGVILADLFSQTATGTPNAIAVAQGSDFAASGTESHALLDDSGRVGTVLDEACVEVNQHRAPIFHLLPGQVNFQIPSNTGLGAATVQFIRGCGTSEEVRSNAAPFQIAAVQPVFFLFSEDPPTAALHSDSSIVAEVDALPGRVSRPAKGGDIVTFFGTGFGPVIPPLASGELAVQPRALAAESVRPMIGEIELPGSDIFYAGAAPSFAGLYQLSVRIPETVPDGTHAFSVMLDGVQSPAGPQLIVSSVEPGPPVCAVDMVVMPGESCTTTSSGIDATFTVDEDGQACVSVPTLNVNLCGEDSLDLTLFGASVSKNEDGSWTIVQLP